MPSQTFLTFKTRQRTVCIDIHGGHPHGKANWHEWSDFLDNDLQVEPLEVKEVGIHTLTRLLMLQVETDEEYERILGKLQAGVDWPLHGSKVYGWSNQEQLTTVKLMNVTQSLDLNKLKKKIEEYGKIVQWTLGRHPRYQNSFDNTITVKLMLRNDAELPAFLPSASMGEVIHLISEAINKACLRCLGKGHIAPHCKKGWRNFKGKSTSSVWSPLLENEPTPEPQTPTETQVDLEDISPFRDTSSQELNTADMEQVESFEERARQLVERVDTLESQSLLRDVEDMDQTLTNDDNVFPQQNEDLENSFKRKYPSPRTYSNSKKQSKSRDPRLSTDRRPSSQTDHTKSKK